MTRFLQFRTVKGQLAFWMVIIGVVPLILTGVAIGVQRTRVIKANATAKLEAVRNLKVREVNNWIGEREADIHMIADDPGVLSLGGISEVRGLGSEDEALLAVVRARFWKYVENYDAYFEVMFIDRSGTIKVSTREKGREGRSRIDQPYFKEPMRTRDTYIQSIYYSQFERKNTMAFARPVLCVDHEGEHVTGVVVAKIDLEASLYSVLLEDPGMGETGEILIVGSGGIALNDLRWHDDAPLNLRIRAQPAALAVGGERGTAEAPDYRGERVLAAYTPIRRMGWGLVAKQDLSEVYSSVRKLPFQIAGVVSVLVVYRSPYRSL